MLTRSHWFSSMRRSRVMLLLMLVVICLPVTVLASADMAAGAAVSSDGQGFDTAKWGLVAAALAFGMGALGAGMAIARVGAAAMGAMSEKPEIGSRALIFVAMAEGIAVFGFIVALMILGKF